jgi:hypothetical protein
MAYCTVDEVRNIISSSLSDTDITALIVLADQEIADRLLTSRGSVKLISMYLTASLIALREPQTMSTGGVSTSVPMTSKDWREMAESLIRRTGGLPIIIKNDPLPNE